MRLDKYKRLAITLIVNSKSKFLKSIFIISGEKGSGKTTFLKNISAQLQMSDFIVGGFIAFHNLQSDCYWIKDIKTNEEASLMQRVATFEQRPHHFKFFPGGVEMGNDCIKKLLFQPPNIAIVDEIGAYELDGELWSSSFTQLIKSSIPVIFTTKDRLLKRVMKKWEIKPAIIFQSKDFDDTHKAFERIKELL